ncbi:MAG: TonB-dependent receptor [Candidatus Tectomicrobia bacterium]|nr:TonB-dependent receptor [Candidatus Tectomicrobia bacterium]
MSNQLFVSAVVGFAFVVASAINTSALAADGAAERGGSSAIEEIVVTARKREESFVDVPASLTVVTAQQLEAYDTEQLKELAHTVPNMYVQQTVVGKQISIRGLGNASINSHFDQAVGLAVDGLSLQRQATWELGYFDVERVEILRGPQGSYFGRNTTAGLINVTTKGASEEFAGSVSAAYEDETEEQVYKASLSGPIADRLGGRIVVQNRDSAGWMQSTPSPYWHRQVPKFDETLGRLTLEWAPTDNVEISSKTAFTDFRMDGTNTQHIECNPGFLFWQGAALALGFINNPDDCTPDDRRSGSAGITGGINGDGTDRRDFEGWMQTITVEWDLANEFTLVSVTGYQEYDSFANFPASWTEARGSTAQTSNEWDDFSQEVRIMSPEFDWGSFVAGAFYNTSDYEDILGVDFNFPVIALGALPFASSALKTMNREQQSFAVFGEVMWNFSEDWTLTLGGRYTRDEKDIHIFQTLGPLGVADDPTAIEVASPYIGLTALTGWRPFDLRGDDEFSDFTPSATLEWSFSDNGNVYVSYKEGFKSGGFDQGISRHGPGGPNDPPIGFSFDSEKTQAIEVGLKLEFPEQGMLLSAAVFTQEFTDLQLQAFAPRESALVTPNLITRNAADSTSEGIEIDLLWQASENLRVNAGFAYLDAAYDSFSNAPCFPGQTEAQGCDVANDVQDLSGETLVMAPEVSATVGFMYYASLGNSGLELEFGGDLGYRSEANLAPDYPPGSESDALTMINATIALKGQDDRWVLRVVGRNLLDEDVLIHHQRGFQDGFIGALTPPRRFQAQLTFNF